MTEEHHRLCAYAEPDDGYCTCASLAERFEQRWRELLGERQ